MLKFGKPGFSTGCAHSAGRAAAVTFVVTHGGLKGMVRDVTHGEGGYSLIEMAFALLIIAIALVLQVYSCIFLGRSEMPGTPF